MPGLIESFVLLALTSAGVTGAALGIGVTLLTGVIGIGISLGLSALSAAIFKPDQNIPKPEDIQTSVRNPTAARVRHYGRVKISGPWAFGESKAGNFHKVIALGTGQLDAIEEYFVDDKIVTLDGSGDVQTVPWLNGGNEKIRIQARLGLPTETHYSQLTTVFPEWDSDHRGDGVSSLYAIQRATSQETYMERFPGGINTLYRVVARASKVYNPITATTVWTDNAAAIMRDYITHADGMRLPASLVNTPQAAAGWLAAANICAQDVALKAGGTEDRYRIWGSYRLDERPADVIGRMLSCADARLVPTPDGGLTVEVGEWVEPTVTIDADTIVGFSELSRGRDVMTTANIIRATYTSPIHDYQTTDADQWIDDADVALRGEIANETSFMLSPSHGQTRRLMKLAAYRANPNWVGSFQCNLKGLAAFGKRFVRVTYPLFGIDEVFEVTDFRFDIGEGGILTGVTLQVSSMPEEAYEWDAATEEGTGPVYEETIVDNTVPVPTGFNFSYDRITVGGSLVPYGILLFDAAPSESLRVEGRYKLTSASEWNVVAVAEGATEAQTNALSDGATYEAQVRHVTLTGRIGAWTASDTITPVADEVAPSVVTGVSKTGGVGIVDINWTSPNSANYVAANIRRNTVNTEGSAVLVRTEYGAPSAADTWQDSALAAGTYYYWIKARNASGVESASVATGSVVVT